MKSPHDPLLIPSICSQIEQHGYVVIDQPFSETLISGLLALLMQSKPDEFQPAGIGRAGDYQNNTDIRRDQIMWLNDNSTQAEPYLNWIEKLRLALNERFYLGLNEYECMFAHYPKHAFYRKHLDAFKQQKTNRNRKLSTILYLNQDWQNEDGGELLLYQHETEQAFKKISPQLGRLVIFLSEEFPHEVLPAKRSRYSLTGWFRTMT
ncbi:MAG: 2OG-Fe(II) oxygenase [Marinicella sp.]